jgi:hypothetical protein
MYTSSYVHMYMFMFYEEISVTSSFVTCLQAWFLDQFGVLHDGKQPYPGAILTCMFFFHLLVSGIYHDVVISVWGFDNVNGCIISFLFNRKKAGNNFIVLL